MSLDNSKQPLKFNTLDFIDKLNTKNTGIPQSLTIHRKTWIYGPQGCGLVVNELGENHEVSGSNQQKY